VAQEQKLAMPPSDAAVPTAIPVKHVLPTSFYGNGERAIRSQFL
jgi:hypothetical protein